MPSQPATSVFHRRAIRQVAGGRTFVIGRVVDGLTIGQHHMARHS